MSKVSPMEWPIGTGPIYENPTTRRQERVNSFHYNSVRHPVEPGKCCEDTCVICANKACAPIICLYETCVLGGKCCTECIKKLKETGMNQDDVNEAENTLGEIPPDGIKMTRGGRRRRRRKRGGGYIFGFYSIGNTRYLVKKKGPKFDEFMTEDDGKIKLYDYLRVINNQDKDKEDSWYDKKYEEGGAFIRMHSPEEEKKGGRTRRRKRKRRRKSTKKKRKRRRTKKKRRRTKKKRRRR